MARLLLGGFLLIVLAVGGSQDSFDLHKRYGEPDVERFAIRPDITMTVEYGSDGKACVLEIEPRQAFIHQLSFSLPTMSKETAQDVLKEVVPPEARGTELAGSGGSFQSSCGAVVGYAYENLTISLGINACTTPSSVPRAEVQFKRPVCSSVR
jgi:hypothetical protein